MKNFILTICVYALFYFLPQSSPIWFYVLLSMYMLYEISFGLFISDYASRQLSVSSHSPTLKLFNHPYLPKFFSKSLFLQFFRFGSLIIFCGLLFSLSNQIFATLYSVASVVVIYLYFTSKENFFIAIENSKRAQPC